MRFPNRRLALRGLYAAPFVLGGLALLLWLPSLVRNQVVARVESRLGLDARVSDVSLGFGSVSLEQLEIGSGANEVSVRVRDVVVDASPLMLALRGTRAVDGVRVGALEADLPLHASSAKTLFERLRARSAGAAKPDADGGGAPLELTIERIAVAIRDEHGELVRVEGSAAATGSGARAELATLRVGQTPGHALELERVVVEAQRGAQGLRLRRASAGRARAALAKLPVLEKPAESAGADAQADPDPPVQAAVADTAPNDPPSTWTRLLRAADRVSGGPAKAASATPQAAGGKGAPGAVLARLTDDAVLSLDSASVHAGGFEQPPILDALSATLKVQKERALSLTGHGKSSSGGALAWDLVLRPEQLQADGRIALTALPLDLIAPFLPRVPWYEPEQGRVDAQLVVKTESAQVIALSGEASLRDAAIAAARIAPAPVRNIGVALRGEGKFMPFDHRLEIAEAELRVEDAALQVKGAVEWSSDHYLFDVDVVLPPTPCTQAVRVIPEDLLGEMALATWQGKLGGRLRLKLDSRDLDATELDVDVQDRCEFATVPIMADLRRFQFPFVHSVVEPKGGVFEMETGPGTPNWTYLEDISPFFVHAVLAHEDGGFFSHRGFSLNHIRNALVRNLKEGRYVVGASTITMQLVKNVFLHREKTLARKIQEVLLTWWIERVMEKRDILELYLNVIEYGPSVYGIRNGARHYFNRLPSQLSPAEGVYLSTILPNPKRYHVHFERGALSPQWVEIMRRMLVRLRERGSYSPEAVEYGLAELRAFQFVPEGTIAPPRQIEGGAAPLPYMRGYGEDPGWDDDLGGNSFGFEEPMPTRVEPNARRGRPAP